MRRALRQSSARAPALRRTARAFRALVVQEPGAAATLRRCDAPAQLPRQDPDADVLVDVQYSSLNYKDALIALGRKGVVKGYPIVPGIDYAGTVRSSSSPLFNEGDAVVLTGNKAGQHFDGGYAEQASCQAGWLVPLPKGLTAHSAMVIGTAGITAMMCVAHLETAGGLRPGRGPVLVTGAAGGLGHFAVAILAACGYDVVASTGRADAFGATLRALGAKDVIGRLDKPSKPLAPQQWAGVVDAVGGETLASAMASTCYGGAIASTGVAGGGDLHATVYPLILRGVRLLGVDSTLPWNVDGYPAERERWEAYRAERLQLWERCDEVLGSDALRSIHSGDIGLDGVVEASHEILEGAVGGRIVVRLKEDD